MHTIKTDHDFHGCMQQQAQMLRRLRHSKVESDNVVAEIETFCRSERSEPVFRVRMPLAPRLKWRFRPTERCRFWWLMIGGNRVNGWNHLAENPGLKPQPDDIMARAHRLAVSNARKDTRLSPRTSPSSSPWSFDQVISHGSWSGDA